ncbi:P-type conjugative transfer protein TrbJ [Sphingomonas sp. ASV193]|uniref:P-type conjugative transfer protein TrbJ n=1 Tax=Sphingomonas sp. ASV193 TaxID=3144405 RepID=UPI0032E863AE
MKLYVLSLSMLALPLTAIVPATPAAAVIPVFDAANYSQNLLSAARALEQINHQLSSLQNEATMLQNMARDLQRIDFPELTQLTGALKQSEQLIDQAKGIDFKVDRLDERLRAMFPGSVDQALRGDERVAQARARLDAAMDGTRRSMEVQANVAGQVREDADLLVALVARSQNASGNLEVSQATNQLLALSAKQQFQLEQLMATEFRSQALDRARRAQDGEEARAATRRFLGTGQAYTKP